LTVIDSGKEAAAVVVAAPEVVGVVTSTGVVAVTGLLLLPDEAVGVMDVLLT
jgi:hypothetical protein